MKNCVSLTSFVEINHAFYSLGPELSDFNCLYLSEQAFKRSLSDSDILHESLPKLI